MINTIEIVFIFLIIVCLIWVFFPLLEGFDATGTEFPPVGCPQYGLRGEELNRSDIRKYYIRPERNVRLSQTEGVMWESNLPPNMEGIPGCKREQCPINSNEFDV